MYYLGVLVAWILIIFNSKQYFNHACIIAILHVLFSIANEIQEHTKKVLEQRESQHRSMQRSIEAIAMDLLNKIK